MRFAFRTPGSFVCRIALELPVSPGWLLFAGVSLSHVFGFGFFAVVAGWCAVQVVLGVSAGGAVFEFACD